MVPQRFAQANRILTCPSDMKDSDCGNLPTFTDGVYCISLWGMSWRERLLCLFKGRVWLWVHSGKTQPPVALTVDSPWLNRMKQRARLGWWGRWKQRRWITRAVRKAVQEAKRGQKQGR